ncbi:MAG: peptidoglycan DD-metalloendopeptidase family protein [Thermomicrobiales bacterium]
MDVLADGANEFDVLVRAIAAEGNRRVALRAMIGSVLVGALNLNESEASRRKQSRKHDQNTNKDKDKDKHNKSVKKVENAGSERDQTSTLEIGSLDKHGRAGYSTTIGIRAPWALNSYTPYATWKVVQGYQASPSGFHCSTNSNKQALAFDMVPETGDAGGRAIYAPVSGVTSVYSIGTGRGSAVEIRTSNGYRVVLYHLMNVAVGNNVQVAENQYLGQVFDKYNYAGTTLNHLHLHVNDAYGNPVPLKIAGRLYAGSTSDRCVWPGKWANTRIRENALFKEPNQAGPALRVLSSAPGIAGSEYTAWNDSISSARVNDGCKITLYQHTNYTGYSYLMSVGMPFLPSYIDNQTSSVRLICS